jgi:hypothetical protein
MGPKLGWWPIDFDVLVFFTATDSRRIAPLELAVE